METAGAISPAQQAFPVVGHLFGHLFGRLHLSNRATGQAVLASGPPCWPLFVFASFFRSANHVSIGLSVPQFDARRMFLRSSTARCERKSKQIVCAYFSVLDIVCRYHTNCKPLPFKWRPTNHASRIMNEEYDRLQCIKGYQETNEAKQNCNLHCTPLPGFRPCRCWPARG